MPNTSSAAKAMRSSPRKRMRNKSIKSALKTFLSKAEKLMTQNAAEEAAAGVAKATSALDKAAQKGIIHANKAARHKSHLAKKLAEAQRSAAAAAAAAAAAVAPEEAPAKPRKRATRKAQPKD